MIMKTTKEMIEVMQAYERGEKIECFNDDYEQWKNVDNPIWDWLHNDYRVKPKKSYVQFRTPEEFLAAQREHEGGMICIDDGCVFGWHDVSLTLHGHVFLHERNKSGEVISFFGNLLDLFEGFKMADGTPCGKEVKS